jgi:hypothetical protein
VLSAVAAVAGVVAGVVIAGCSASTHAASTQAGSQSALGAAGAAGAPAIAALGPAADGSGASAAASAAAGGTADGDSDGSSVERAPAAAAVTSGASASTSTPTDALPGASLIKTVQLTVTVQDVPAQADRADAIATGAGGTIDGDQRNSGTPTSPPTATITLRVPPTALSRVLGELSRLGHEDNRNLSTDNVSTEVADVDSRVRSAQETIAALRVLYARAVKVSDVIDIETQLAQRESDLESLQARQRVLAEQVALATVTLNLRTASPAAAKHTHPAAGFAAGAGAGWRAFVRAAQGFFAGLGAALPFAAVVVLVGVAALVARGIARRRRRVRTPAAGASPSN